MGQSWLSRVRRARPSRIGRRLLAFNLLLVFLPVAGILYLDVYETRLLDLQERGMVQQARLVAAALRDREQVLPADGIGIVSRLGRRRGARSRSLDANGGLIGGSRSAPRLPLPYGPAGPA